MSKYQECSLGRYELRLHSTCQLGSQTPLTYCGAPLALKIVIAGFHGGFNSALPVHYEDADRHGAKRTAPLDAADAHRPRPSYTVS